MSFLSFLIDLCFFRSNRTISANNTPSVSPCSSPTLAKKDVFSKIAALTSGKTSIDNSSTTSVHTPPTTQHPHIHRHHRNTSTVSQNDTVLTTQPSTQSIACNSISDQSYAYVKPDASTSTANLVNNGTNSSRKYVPSTSQTPSTSTTSESVKIESSPSTLSSNSSMTAPSPNTNQWRHKLTNLKQSFQNVGTPRFHRRPKVLRKNTSSFFSFFSLFVCLLISC